MQLQLAFEAFCVLIIILFIIMIIMQVLASKTKIYMVLEYVNGGELFDKIVSKLCHLIFISRVRWKHV